MILLKEKLIMNNNKKQLELYATKVKEFVDIIKDLFEKKIFQEEGVESIYIMRYTKDKKIRLVIDFYDKDGCFMLPNEEFKEIKEISKIPHIIYTLNTLKIDKEPFFDGDTMLTIDTVKGCEQMVLEALLPKKLQIEIDYNDLQDEIGNNLGVKTNKVKI
jgi:hypothetical protein